MYSKQEASILTHQFWTSLGQYLAPIPSAEGEKINWINYKTGEKDIRFLMDAQNNQAKISITLSHNDIDLQKLYFEKMEQLKNKLYQFFAEKWHWNLHCSDSNGKIISEIYTSLQNVSILNQNEWPLMITFFKERLIAMDKFWCENKYAFER
jgi:flagellar basal body-associated protein FliL